MMDQYDDDLQNRWSVDFSVMDGTNEMKTTQHMSQHWDYGCGGAANSTVVSDGTAGHYYGGSWFADDGSPSHFSRVGGWQFSPLNPSPYANWDEWDPEGATWTGDANGSSLNTRLGCEVSDVQNHTDTLRFTQLKSLHRLFPLARNWRAFNSPLQDDASKPARFTLAPG